MKRRSEVGSTSERRELQVLWRLCERCNFRCEYCFRDGVDAHRGAEHPDCAARAPDHIARSFDATGHPWLIRLTGGEPFLYPGFLELVAALTQHHRVAINTNLGAPGVRELADRIAPSRVHSIYATLHLREVERHRLTESWIEAFLELQAKGFPMRLALLTHPALLPHLGERIEMLRSQGVVHVYVKILRGQVSGRQLPTAYSQSERRLIRAAGPSDDELGILEDRVHFRGLRCAAGCTAFDLDLHGNLTRCSGVRSPRGNLFAGRFDPDVEPRRCPVWTCTCPYQGLRFARRVGSWARVLERAAPAAHRLARRLVAAHPARTTESAGTASSSRDAAR